jgi:hypothetical protein
MGKKKNQYQVSEYTSIDGLPIEFKKPFKLPNLKLKIL